MIILYSTRPGPIRLSTKRPAAALHRDYWSRFPEEIGVLVGWLDRQMDAHAALRS
jgi:hypothetical protein